MASKSKSKKSDQPIAPSVAKKRTRATYHSSTSSSAAAMSATSPSIEETKSKRFAKANPSNDAVVLRDEACLSHEMHGDETAVISVKRGRGRPPKSQQQSTKIVNKNNSKTRAKREIKAKLIEEKINVSEQENVAFNTLGQQQVVSEENIIICQQTKNIESESIEQITNENIENKQITITKTVIKSITTYKSNKIVKSSLSSASFKSSNLQKNKVLVSKNGISASNEASPVKDEVAFNASNQAPDLNDVYIDDAILFYKNYYTQKTQTIEPIIEDMKLTKRFETPIPPMTWTNNNELWAMMHLNEIKYRHDRNYMKRHIGIEPHMRSILIDWLAEISNAYRLHRETFHLAIEYMDRFMTRCSVQQKIERLQLIGLTSLFMAAKVEEIYPPKLKDFSSHMENYSSCNDEAMQQFELFMLKTLNWEISPMTANSWLMCYLQIAAINYHSLSSSPKKNGTDTDTLNTKKIYNSHFVMPLNIYKNTNLTLKDYLKKQCCNSVEQNNETYIVSSNRYTSSQQTFYLHSYLKSVTLLDLCMFDVDSLNFSYSMLAAAALYHMASIPSYSCTSSCLVLNVNTQNKHFVEQCTGYTLTELDSCIKWMLPFADTCKCIITEEKMIAMEKFAEIETEDAHNIQSYFQYLDLMKVAESRRTPCDFNTTANVQILLTPPGSVHKYAIESNGEMANAKVT